MAEEVKKEGKKTQKRSRSTLKRIKQNIKRNLHNVSNRSKMKSAISNYKSAVESNANQETQKNLLNQAYSLLDKAAKTGLIKTNAAGRKKSRLASLIAKQREAQ